MILFKLHLFFSRKLARNLDFKALLQEPNVCLCWDNDKEVETQYPKITLKIDQSFEG